MNNIEQALSVANWFPATRVWAFLRNHEYTLPYEYLEQVFNELALKEGIIDEKQSIKISSVIGHDDTKQLQLTTEIYRIREN